jgi:hypothetical protein
MKRILLPLFLTFWSSVAFGQPYWQQRVDTRLDVKLDDTKHMLRGYEEFLYTNNSKDTLKYIYIHLWPNAYSHDHTPYAEQQYRNGHTDFYYSKAYERGYIDSLQFTVDGSDVEYFSSENTPDIARIDLPRPLPPGKQMKVTTPFRVKIPKVFSRLGHTGTAYYISQWFPKPAVYDKKGWHPISYLDLGEFYSEIGSYDVSVTLPKNYIVMATGNLQDAEEQNWLDSVSTLPLPSDTLFKTVKPRSSAELKTLHFKEENVHDFAWFADKRWIVRKDTVSSPGTGDLVTTYAAFLPSHQKQWSKANEHIKNAIRYYGKWVGPYPYKTAKAVQGDMLAGGGMEYPTVTIIDRNAGDQTTIIHEVGHNWFQGILATNERDHAWMDEGLNTFYETKTSEVLRSKDTAKSSKRVGRGNVNINLGMKPILYELAAAGLDQSIAQTSENFKEINYGMDVYYKTAYMAKWLEDYMGDESFEAGMHEYYTKWKHKHPYPEDFQAIMQKHTEKPIDWFFSQALKTDDLIDFSVKYVTTDAGGVKVLVKNKTDMPLPVSVKAYRGDSVLATGQALPFTGTTTITLPEGASAWSTIRISPDVPDGRTPNNEFRRSGIHRSGLGLMPFFGTNMSNKQRLYFSPAVGYNVYDGFEAGLVLHNLTWPETKFKYVLAPLYGFRSKELIGAGSIGYFWRPDNLFSEVSVQADLKSFHYDESELNIERPIFARYLKIAPSLNFSLRPISPISSVTRTLTLKGYYIQERQFKFPVDPADTAAIPGRIAMLGEYDTKGYGLVRYRHANSRTFNPFDYTLEGQVGEDFIKLSFEGNIKINYNAKGKSLYVRAFAGKFFTLNDAGFEAERYYLNSTYTGLNDYLYDDTYIGRTETSGFASRQRSIREGGLKMATFSYLSSYGIGRSDNWLGSLNLKTDLPLKKLPIRLFLDMATFANAGKLNPSGNKVLFDGGIEIYLLDMVNIYVPLIMSKDFRDYQKTITGKTSILDGISFSIQLNKINWLKAPSGIFKVMGY